MTTPQTLPISVLREILRYDENLGFLYWRERTAENYCGNNLAWWNTLNAHKRAFKTDMGNGHLQGVISGRSYLADRIIWAIVHGSWPDGQIDHINGILDDNRIENLKIHRKRKSNTSGHHENHGLEREV